MDMKKKHKIPNRGNLPDLSRQRLAVGAKQLRKAVRAGTVRCVYLAENADPAVTQPLSELCRLHQVPVSWVRSMAELGRSCGIEVGAAAAAAVE